MANAGPGTNRSNFITCCHTPDGKHTVFGALLWSRSVDSIVQNDVINKVTIIRKGSEAKFDAPKVFSDYFNEKNNLRQNKKTRSR